MIREKNAILTEAFPAQYIAIVLKGATAQSEDMFTTLHFILCRCPKYLTK